MTIQNLEFSDKKVVDYLNTGLYKKVLLKFFHGLGDAINFYVNDLQILKKKYPDIEFTFGTHLGQEEIFGYYDRNEENYDICFDIVFPCSEWDYRKWTKGQKSAEIELGFPINEASSYQVKDFSNFPNPLVAVHFFSTAVPTFNVNENFAKSFCDRLIENGMIPIDTYFKHAFSHDNNYAFEKRTLDDISPTCGKLIGILNHCAGIASAISGNLWLAMMIMPPEKILMLYNGSHIRPDRITSRLPFCLDMEKPFNFEIFNSWLSAVKKP